MYIPQGRTAETYRCRNIAEAALHKDHIRSVYGNIGACTDRNTDIGTRKGWRIVYPIADHCDLAALFKPFYLVFLAFGQHTCNDLIDTRLSADSLCCALVVAGYHYNMYTHAAQLSDRLWAVLLYHIGNCDNTEKLIAFCKEQRRFSRFGK